VGGTVWQHVTERSGVHQPARRGRTTATTPASTGRTSSRPGVFWPGVFSRAQG